VLLFLLLFFTAVVTDNFCTPGPALTALPLLPHQVRIPLPTHTHTTAIDVLCLLYSLFFRTEGENLGGCYLLFFLLSGLPVVVYGRSTSLHTSLTAPVDHCFFFLCVCAPLFPSAKQKNASFQLTRWSFSFFFFFSCVVHASACVQLLLKLYSDY
jgi:hypothetical protein